LGTALETIRSPIFWSNLLAVVYVLEPLLVRVRFFDVAAPGSICWVLEAWDGLRVEFQRRMLQAGRPFCDATTLPDLLAVIDKYRSSTLLMYIATLMCWNTYHDGLSFDEYICCILFLALREAIAKQGVCRAGCPHLQLRRLDKRLRA